MEDKLDNIDISSLKAKEVKELANSLREDDYFKFLLKCKNDERKSIINICSSIEKKIEKLKKEDERLVRMNSYEESMYMEGYSYIGGVDEAGRGPLAGPVVAACVVFDRNTKIRWIDDSKKLSEEKREELYNIIINNAKDYGIGICDNHEIDEHNILNATYIAMQRAISQLKKKPDCLLNDALIIPNIDARQIKIIKGDAKSISIAAASILAKVTRDRMMYEYDKDYPGYGFESNKGYGTRVHYEGIEKNGITPIHRLSFLKNILDK